MKMNSIYKIMLLLFLVPALVWGVVYNEDRIVASDGAAADLFGFDVDATQSVMIVGAPGYDGSTDELLNSGAAYVYSIDGLQWYQQTVVTPDKPAAGEYFGSSVAIEGTTLVIAAPGDVESDPSDSYAGNVYVFDYTGAVWQQTQLLIPTVDDRAVGDVYGISVDISGDYIAVGASLHDQEALADAGVVYIFKKNESTWSHVQTITASDAAAGDQFGHAVSLDGNHLVVGAKGKDIVDPLVTDAGAAYFFTLASETWSQVYKYPENSTVSTNFMGFGSSVSLSGTTAVVGCPADQTTDGSVYVFNYASESWSQNGDSPLTPASLDENTWWGKSVVTDGELILGGDYGYGTHGAAFTYTFDGTNWAYDQMLTPETSQEAGGDMFGFATALAGTQLVVGARNGVGGDAGTVNTAGAVYVNSQVPLNAAFMGVPTTGYAAQEIVFTDQSTGDISAWAWNFGDGTTSTEQNPRHYYSAAGMYTVSLTVTQGVETDTEEKVEYITMQETQTFDDWKRVRLGADVEESLYDVQVLNETTAIAVGGWTNGHLLKTTDDGMVWSRTDFNDRLSDVYFIDDNTGYIVGNNGFIAKTTNGGETWSSSNHASGYFHDDVWFTDANTGYITGFNYLGSNSGGWILKTTDGGENWNEIAIAKETFPVTAVEFIDANVGYVVGGNTVNSNSGFVYKTTDAGANWTKILDTSQKLWDVHFVNANTGFAVGRAGMLVKTTDAGENWSEYVWASPPKSFLSVDFLDENHGFIGMEGAEVAITEDGGTTWAITELGSLYHSLYSVDMHNSGDGYMVGQNGIILKYAVEPFLAAFQASPVTGTAPLTVNFTDQSTGDPVSWSWSFGDGSVDDSQNPSHVYEYPGTYTVALTVSDGEEQNTATETNLITVRITQPENYSWTCIPRETMFPGADQPVVNQMAFDPFDSTVVVATSQGVTEYSGIYWRNFQVTNNDNWPQVNAVAVDSSGRRWYGLSSGVRMFSPTDTTFHDPTESGVNDIYVAPDTTIWIATDAGLAHYDWNTWTVYTKENSGLTENQVNRVTKVPDETMMLISTNGGGLNAFDYQENSWETFTSEDGLPYDVVYNVVFGKNGKAWMALYHGGIVEFTDQDNFTVHTPIDDGEAGLYYSSVGVDSSGNIWAASANSGIARYDGVSWTTFDAESAELCSEMPRAKNVLVEPNGNLWFGTQDAGMIRFGAPEAQGVDFYANVTSGYAPLTVQFYGYASGGTPTYWSWDFQNDNDIDVVGENEKNPSFTFTEPGVYTVKLFAPFGANNQQKIRYEYIHVLDDNDNAGDLNGQITDAVNGDGIPGATVRLGEYTTTTDVDGYYSFTDVPVTDLVADFIANPRSGNAPLNVQFSDLSAFGRMLLSVSATGYTDYSTLVNVSSDVTTFNVSMSPTIEEGGMRIVLSWGATPLDLDVHLLTPEIEGDTYEVYYSYKGNSSAAPYALLDLDDTNGYGPETITLYDTFTGTYKCYVYNYSGTPAITASNGVVRIYNDQGILETIYVPNTGEGNYWYVCDVDGATGSVTVVNTLSSSAPDGAVFNAEQAEVKPELPQMARNSGASTNAITSWQWDFDNDGTVDATDQNPSYTFEAGGTYTVKLTVSDGENTDTEIKEHYVTVIGSTGSINGYVTDAVNGNPLESVTVTIAGRTTTTNSEGYYQIDNVPLADISAAFSAYPRSGNAPLSVQFQDLSSSNSERVFFSVDGYYAYNQLVSLDDEGTTLNVSLSPEVGEGQMRVVLTWGSAPSDLDLHMLTPDIGGTPYEIYYSNKGNSDSAPFAQLDIDDTSAYGPETITLYDQFTGTYKVFIHNYSGSPDITTSSGTIQVFGGAGLIETINVPTTGTGLYWYACDIDGETGAVTVVNTIENEEPAGAVLNPLTYAAKEPQPQLSQGVNSGNEVTSWHWDFDNDGVIDDDSQNPTFVYTTPGTYTVKLTVSDGEHTDSEIKQEYITVTGNYGSISGKVIDAVTGDPLENVTVTVAGMTTTTDASGNYVLNNVPLETLSAAFSGYPRTGSAPLEVQFQDLSSVNAQRVYFDFEGYYSYNQLLSIAESGTVLNISLSPEIGEGQMRVVLSWGDAPSDLDLHMKTPAIEGNTYEIYYSSKGSSTSAPYAELDIDDTSAYGPETITLYDQFAGTYKVFIYNYSGSPDIVTSGASLQVFGDTGLKETINVPTSGEGHYWYVCDIDGATGNVTVVNTIGSSAPEGALFTPQTYAVKAPQPQYSQGAVMNTESTSWKWDFDNDGVVDDISQNPTHIYATPGTYTVKLTISNGENEDVEIKENYVTVSGSYATVSGKVTDAVNGDPIAGATIVIAGQTTTTDENGNYELTNVLVGTLSADFTGSPRSGTNPLTVQFEDKSSTGAQLLSVSAEGYYGYEQLTSVEGSGVTVNVALSPEIGEGQMRVVLTWGDTPSDLDIHMLTPTIEGNKYEVYYSSKGSSTNAPFVELDIDDTSAYGPETITMYNRYTGTYKVYVHNYSGSPEITQSNGTVQVFGDTGLLETIHVPTIGEGDYWNVCNIDGVTGQVIVINTLTEIEPEGALFGSNPQFTDLKPSINYIETASTSGSVTSWKWDFDGDGTIDSEEENPAFTYTEPGSYTVKLTVSDGLTQKTRTRESYINVDENTTTSGYYLLVHGINSEQFPQINTYVSVIDTSSDDARVQVVDGLSIGNFDITENGIDESVTSVNKVSSSHPAKLDMVFVVDISTNMASTVSSLKTYLSALGDSLSTHGIDYRFGLVTYSDAISTVGELTSDSKQFKAWFETLETVSDTQGDGVTNSLLAVYKASRLGFRNYAAKAVMVITNNSHYTTAQISGVEYTDSSLAYMLKEQGIVCHYIGPDSENNSYMLPYVTGGALISYEQDMSNVIDDLKDVLTSLYVVTYTTLNTSTYDGTRSVVVKAVSGDKNGYGTGRYFVGSSRLVTEPTQILGLVGNYVTLNINGESLVNVDSCYISLDYDTTALDFVGHYAGSFLSQDGSSLIQSVTDVNGRITIQLGRNVNAGTAGINGTGTLYALRFQILSTTSSNPVSFSSFNLWDPNSTAIAVQSQNPTLESPYVSGTTNSRLLGDFDNSLAIDTRDFVLLATYWNTTNPTGGDIGPATGSMPFLTATPDNEVSYEDLFVFTQMWNWYHDNYKNTGSSLSKVTNKIGWADVPDQEKERTVKLNITAQEIANLGMGHLQVKYDPLVLRYKSASAGDLLNDNNTAIAFFADDQSKAGVLDISLSRLASAEISPEIAGTGVLATIEFERVDLAAESQVTLNKVDLRNSSNHQFILLSDIETQVAGMKLPTKFELSQNYPNPFNNRTTFQYSLPQDSKVEITIFNVLGQPVRTLVSTKMDAGVHNKVWDGNNDVGNLVSSGVYFVQMKAGTFKQIREIVFLK